MLNYVLPQEPTVFSMAAPLLGHRMRLDPQSQKGYLLGTYEPGCVRIVQTLVKPGWFVADLGAHIGYFTLLLAKCVGPEGRVFAFEPSPENFAVLRENIALNGYENVHVEQKAVSNKDGTVILRPGPGTLSSMNAICEKGRGVAVEAVALDHWFLSQRLPTLHFLKIDIEGAEDLAIEGMQCVLLDCRPILLLEVHGGRKSRALVLLQNAGYSLDALGSDGSLRTATPEESGHILARPV
jgi:FkbM family methyltransferase